MIITLVVTIQSVTRRWTASNNACRCLGVLALLSNILCVVVFVSSVSHKKLILMRWEKAAVDSPSLPLSPPPSPHTSQPHTLTEDEPVKRPDSPLFEELSDEEFEDTRKNADTADEKGDNFPLRVLAILTHKPYNL